MSDESRREFLLKLATGAVYAAPVVRTLSAPESLAGQASPSAKGEMKGQDMTSGALNTFQPSFGPSAPWTQNP